MESSIRVLHVFGSLDMGGSESRTMDIYRTIDRKKVQFDFAIHTSEEVFFSNEIESLGGKIFRFPRFNGKNYFSYKKAWVNFLKENPKYKIIHGHQTSTGFIYLKVAKKNNIPLRIAHSRNSNKDNLIKKYTCKISRYYATNLFAVSKLAGVSEFGNKAVRSGKVKIIPNAIDAMKYSYNPEVRKKKRKELGIEDNFIICHIGRFHPQKNHKFLLDCFQYIKSKNNNVKLILIGDGPLKNDIQKEIFDRGIENSVILTGIRSDVPELLQAMDVLVFPSFYEGLPGVVLEAQASGLPCVISDTITDEVKITDLVEFVSLKESAKYWAEKTLTFQQDLQRRNTFEEFVKEGYDIRSVAKWYEEFYLNQAREL